MTSHWAGLARFSEADIRSHQLATPFMQARPPRSLKNSNRLDVRGSSSAVGRRSPAELERYAAIAEEYERLTNGPAVERLNRVLHKLGVGPVSLPLFDSVVGLADAYMQLSVPSFEFPRKIPTTVNFIGTPPIIAKQAALPPWANDLDGSRKVVLVTQGTVANHNFDLLIAPTLAALANEPDVLVVATAGGRPVESIPGPIPSNARVASYLPFEWLLPKVDVLVTNGGYGSVNQVMSSGIPLVTAGTTEDKADVNARVAWSGVGVNLATNEPTQAALRDAVRTVLDTPRYRARAAAMADEFRGIDTPSEILRVINQVVYGPETERDPIQANQIVQTPRAA
jgi:UDP-glucoronosyl and UDP-glucosyl transferase